MLISCTLERETAPREIGSSLKYAIFPMILRAMIVLSHFDVP